MAGIEITTKIGCENLCSYCPQAVLYQAYPDGADKLMTMATFKTCLDKIPLDVDIHFSGFCEPFMNPNCIDMIQLAFNRGHRVIVYTTLIGASDADLATLPPTGSRFEMNIHVINPDVMRLRNSSIGEWFDKLAWLNKCGVDYLLIMVGENDGMRKRLEERNIRNIYDQPLIARSTKPTNHKGVFRCYDERHNQGVLLPNGDVALCCEDYGLKHIKGNLLTGKYNDLFTSREYRKIIEAMLGRESNVICKDCNRRRDLC